MPYTGPTGAQLRGAFQVLNHPDGHLRRRNPSFKSMISIGGWTMSREFSTVAATPAARARFVESAMQFVAQHGFDGIDIDWEFPVEGGRPENARSPDDGRNLTLLLGELRAGLDRIGQQRGGARRLDLAVCLPFADWLSQHFDVPGLAQHCDHLLLMCYDATGAWSDATGHHSPASCIATAAQSYMRRGAPAAKLVAGLPLSGRAFAGVKSGSVGAAVNKGMAPPGTHAPGIVDWDELTSKYSAAAGYQWSVPDPIAMTPVAYNPATGVWITAENEQSIEGKSRFAVQQLGLGGVMYWELSQDRQGTLVGAALRGMGAGGVGGGGR
ncbi:glycoside hydrolase [Blastocladiella britannica]|nr:glycoside hydrolase [Blastocladiella britannica]